MEGVRAGSVPGGGGGARGLREIVLSVYSTNDGRLRQFRRLGRLNIFYLFGLELEFKLWLASDLVFVVLDRDAQER